MLICESTAVPFRIIFELSGFHQEVEGALAASVDVLTTGSLEDKFLARIAQEEVLLYEQPQH
jgi:predicted nucleotidyltransferase